MEKLKLNKDMGKVVTPIGYKLSGEKKYVIDLSRELPEQTAILHTIRSMELEAIEDWWAWLEANNYATDYPNPTNAHVSEFYGKKPLWESRLSQGIVVKDKNDDDYYIVLECSRENEGFKYTQILITPGGCI